MEIHLKTRWELSRGRARLEKADPVRPDSLRVVDLEVLLLTQLWEGCPAPTDRPAASSGQYSGYGNNRGTAADFIDPSATIGDL